MRVQHPPPPFARAPLLRPLTLSQEVIVNLLGIGCSLQTIADELEITKGMVRWHAKNAAKRIPGDLPTVERCRAWARGATLDVLTGGAVKAYILTPLRSGGNRVTPPKSYLSEYASTGAP